MNENPQDQPTFESPPAASGPPNRLFRGRTNGRVIAGVCGAIGAQMGIPVWIVRLTFIVASFMFGIGLIAYVVGWIVIPAESGDDQSAEVFGRIETVGVDVFRVVAFVALVCVGIGLALVIAGISATLAVFGLAWVVAAAMVALLLLAVLGWPRVRPWILVVIGLAIVIPVVAVAALDVSIDRNVFGVDEAPATAAEIPEAGYVSGLGTVLVDLRKTKLDSGTTTRVPIHADFGVVVVALPADRCVAVELTHKSSRLLSRGFSESDPHGALGLTNLFTKSTDSARARLHQAAPKSSPRVVVNVQSQLAQVLVRSYPDQMPGLENPAWDNFDRPIRQPAESPCVKGGHR